MSKFKLNMILIGIFTLTIGCSATAKEVKTYTGKGEYIASRLTMTLGNGDMVFSVHNLGIGTISTNPPALVRGKCMGFGKLSINDKISTDFYCTLREDDKNALDIKGKEDSTGLKAEVIGGSGRWQGATGQGSFERVKFDGVKGQYKFKLDIVTP